MGTMTKFVESLKEVDLSNLKIPMAVIYDAPKDFPDLILCRIWEGAGCHPTRIAMQKGTLEEMREAIMAAGFSIRFPRAEGDDPVIVETWMR